MATNEYGLDAHYFSRKLERILRDVGSYTPAEMARELVRMAKVADEPTAQAEMLEGQQSTSPWRAF